jgi:uroporphyrinogen decarboxylase
MNSKTRVYNALKRQKTDRVPIYMWFHPYTKEQLSNFLDIPPQFVNIAMSNDIQQTWVNHNYIFEAMNLVEDNGQFSDDWGLTWKRVGYFNQMLSYPLQEANKNDICNYTFPKEDKIKILVDRMKEVVAFEKDYFIGCDVSPCAFAMYTRLRGMENALLDIGSQPDVTQIILNKCIQFSKQLAQKAISKYPLDWLWTGDDVASNKRLLFNPNYWRETIKPGLHEIFKVGKENNLWNVYHCCGAMHDIIPDLIDIGMDVLNPIQSTCPGMDPIELKADFGSKIAFMGGLDTENLLPKGSVVDIQRKTTQLIEVMTNDGGGFVLSGTHTIPPETPLKNIFAIYEVVGITKQEILDIAATIRNNQDLV